MTAPDASTTRRRRWVGGGIVLVLAAALVGIVVERSGGEKVVNAGGDTLVLVGEKSSGSRLALASGRLTDVGGCLGIAPASGSGKGTVVIWPHGTNVETPEPLRVRIDGTVRELGDTVEIGGGFVPSIEPDSYFYDQVPDACRSSRVFVAGGSR